MKVQHTDRLLPETLQQLSSDGDIRHFSKGEVLFQEGDASDALYVLLKGQLKVYSLKGDGREVVYNILEAGEILGELFLDGGPRSASVKAMTDSDCLIVEGELIRELMRTHPKFAECLVIKLIRRLRHTTHKIRSLALDRVYDRVVALLNETAILDGDVRRTPPHLTQQEIASQVGATREMVNHVIRDLIRGGFIHKDQRHRLTLLRKFPEHW